MENECLAISREILQVIEEWEIVLQQLDRELICTKRNKQNRTIKQIVGHLVDSASNNIHRIVQFHYQPDPMIFPDYANCGNNDRWIAIQNYQEEDWDNLIQLWKYTNIHIAHLIRQVDTTKLAHNWINAFGEKISLREMITSYPSHLHLHINEIKEMTP
ncbi:MAG: DinB family protein [Tannerellaceae bacterium]|nr:DinB family protein [Tannerellaceae bacterium]